jgi:glutamine synthetase type III
MLPPRPSHNCSFTLQRKGFRIWSMSSPNLYHDGTNSTHKFIPQLHTIEQFDNEFFDNEDISFSSCAYRIAAVRNLDQIMQSKEVLFLKDPVLSRQEAYLINWNLYLPDNRKNPIQPVWNLRRDAISSTYNTSV